MFSTCMWSSPYYSMPFHSIMIDVCTLVEKYVLPLILGKSDSQDTKRIKLDEAQSTDLPAKQSKTFKIERSQSAHHSGV